MGQIMLVLTMALVTLALVNAIVIGWATVLDARHASVLSRALGATPGQVASAMSAAQILPALPGAALGIPAGIGLYAAVSNGGMVTIPPTSTLIAVVLAAAVVVAVLTAIPARIGAGWPPADVL